MKIYFLTALALTIPTAAAAQSVSTDCYSRKNRVHCTSTYRPSLTETLREIEAMRNRGRPPSGPGSTGRSIVGERILAERAARGEGPHDPPNHDPGFQLFRVAQLIGNGDCPDALGYAVATRDKDTIARAESFCGKVK